MGAHVSRDMWTEHRAPPLTNVTHGARGARYPGAVRRAARPARQGSHEYLCGVVPASYHDFFSACATVAGALIGLLFVAISISPAKLSGPRAENDQQLKAAMAFSALVNTLVIALVTLLPRANLSLTVIIVAAAGLSSTSGLIILLLRDTRLRVRVDQLILPAVLLGLYGLQLAQRHRAGRVSPESGVPQQPGGIVHWLLWLRHRAGLGAGGRARLQPSRRRRGDGPPAWWPGPHPCRARR